MIQKICLAGNGDNVTIGSYAYVIYKVPLFNDLEPNTEMCYMRTAGGVQNNIINMFTNNKVTNIIKQFRKHKASTKVEKYQCAAFLYPKIGAGAGIITSKYGIIISKRLNEQTRDIEFKNSFYRVT